MSILITVLIVLASLFVGYFIVKPRIAMSFYTKQGIPVAFFAPMLGVFYYLIKGQRGKEKDCLHALKNLPAHLTQTQSKAFVTNLGANAMVYFLDAKLIGEFLQKQIDCYEKSKSFTQLSQYLLGSGIVFAEGDDWKQKRKLLSNVFHYNLIEEQVKLVAQVTDRVFDKSNESEFCFLRITEKIGGDVGLMSFLGADVNNYTLFGQEPYTGINNFIAEFIEYMKNPLTMMFGYSFMKKQLRSSDRTIYNKSQELKKLIQTIIKDSIAKHHEAVKNKTTQSEQKGIAAILNLVLEKGGLQTEEEIEEFGSITLNFYFAAKDTISRLLANLFYYIGKYDSIYKDLEKEILSHNDDELTMESLKKYVFLEALLKESLRFCGPAPFLVQRSATVDHVIGPYKIRKGTEVNCNFLANLFSEEYFDNPHTFNPHRWLETEQTDKVRLNPFSFLPFSGGSRNCIGQYFAMMEMKVIVIKFIRRYQQFKIPDNYEFRIALKATIETDVHLTCPLTRRETISQVKS